MRAAERGDEPDKVRIANDRELPASVLRGTALQSSVAGLAWESCLVAPREAIGGIGAESAELVAMYEKLGQVVEGVDAVERGGMDEAEEDVSNVGAVLGPEEERVLAMKDRFRQCSLTLGCCRWVRRGLEGTA